MPKSRRDVSLVGVEKMSHCRLAGYVTVDSLLQLTIRLGLTLVLTEMLGLRVDKKYLDKSMGYLNIAIYSPLIGSITAANAAVVTHRS